MNLRGKNILLRAIELEDIEILRNMLNDENVENCVLGWSFPISKYAQQLWFENQIKDKNNVRYIVEAEGKVIGLATLTNIDWKNRKARQGIKLLSNARGKGYGTDAILTLMKYSFEELQLNRLYATILEYNEASRKLFSKCGWKQEGTFRNSIFKNNKYSDEIIVGILKEEYERMKDKI